MSLIVKTMSEWNSEEGSPEILFWVGSAGAFDDRAKKITRSFVKILNKAKVNFGVLGTEESASGDVAKRAGNEFLFQMQAMMNIEVLNSYNVFFFEPSMFIPHKAYAESDLADELVGSVVKIILSFDTHLTAPTLLFPLPEVKTVVEPLLVLYKINLPPL